MVPTILVAGVNGVAEPVPPVGTVYHINECPATAVAVKGIATIFWQ